MQIEFASVPSPIGTINLAVSDGALCALGFEDYWEPLLRRLETRFGPLGSDARRSQAPRGAAGGGTSRFVRALRSYLEGDLKAIDALPVDMGGTPFQEKVWAALRRIPAGRTASYSEIGRKIGCPAARAVGMANGSNPVSIVVPCHRVIRADGDLCGYGGGLHRKRWLLTHEGALTPALFDAAR